MAYMHYLRFTPNMHNLMFIINLTCTTLVSKGVGGVEAKEAWRFQGGPWPA